MLAFLKKPYPSPAAAIERLRSSITISGFVFLFLWIFQPFELNAIEQNKFAIILGYGVTCLIVMLTVNFSIPELIPSVFAEEDWNTGREILWVLLHISSIALANAAYSDLVGVFELSTSSIINFYLYTVIIGVFPVTGTIVLNQKRLQKKYEDASDYINENAHFQAPGPDSQPARSAILSFPSESGQTELEIETSELYLVKAEGNYVEVIFQRENSFKKLLMRNTMKNIDMILTKHIDLWRCHRSFIVNMQHLEKVSGNAQGYTLHLKNSEYKVPVSRQLNEELKRRIEE